MSLLPLPSLTGPFCQFLTYHTLQIFSPQAVFSGLVPVIHAHSAHSLPTLSFQETSFPKNYLRPSSCDLPLHSFLSCMLPMLSSSLDLPSCLVLLCVLSSAHSLSPILISFLTLIILPCFFPLSSAAQCRGKTGVFDVRWTWVGLYSVVLRKLPKPQIHNVLMLRMAQ